MRRYGNRGRWVWAAGGLAAAALLLGWSLGDATDASAPPFRTGFDAPGRSVSGLSFDGRSLWITLDGEPLIHEVEPDTGRILGTLHFTTPHTGGSAWDGRHLWQLAWQDRRISRIDVRTGRVTKVVPAPGAGFCSGMTFDGEHLWVANFDDRRIYRIDQTRDGRILDQMFGDYETTGLAWDGESLWSGILVGAVTHDTRARTGFVQRFDLETGERTLALPLAGAAAGTASWVPGDGRATHLWWYDSFHHRVVRIDAPAQRALGARLLAPVGAVLLLTLALGGASRASRESILPE